MDKMKQQTPDLTAQNVDRIAALFPNCITESRDENGKLKRAVNFDLLRQMLSGEVVEGDEAYEFTWVGKKAAIVEANRPIRKTLRPCPEESVNWDTTENLYIEGDNLEVLKLLQESYLGKVKMIYIDPPYNTGNDFIYRDNFAVSQQEWSAESGEWSEDGERLFRNTDSNGRFHSDWCSMIYSRLLLARNLLTDDGVIFISIDDCEYDNLKKICDELFGTRNYVGTILWKKKTNGNNMGFLPPVHDYILCFARNISAVSDMGYPVTDDFIAKSFSNPDDDPRGPWTVTDLSANHKGPYFPITNPKNGAVHYPPDGRYWVFNEEEVKRRINDGRIIFGRSGEGKPVQKVFAANRKFGKIRAESWWSDKGMNADATAELAELFGKSKLFTHPKPSKLLYNIIKISTEKDDLILDFFAGSSTTADAIFQLNAEDGGKRKSILIQLPELCEAGSVAYEEGYETITELGKERIRRAGQKIRTEWEEKNTQLTMEDNSALGIPNSALDIGFRVLKLDTTNMTDVYYSADEYDQQMLSGMESNIKPDRTDLDLLFGCLLDWGLPLSMPYTSEEIGGCTVHTYNEGDLIACFNEDIPDSVIREIAKRKPLRAVFRDSSFADSPAKINVGEIFKLLAPDTRVKVI